MSYIEELRQRVESAERRFGLIDEQERRYSERLITLMNALETTQTENQTEVAAHQARVAELERENGELRGMLHALLLGVEAGGRDALAGTLRDLDSRLSGLVSATPASAEEETAGLDAVRLDAAADEAVAIEDAELETADEAPEAAELGPEPLAGEAPAAEEIMAEDVMAEEPMPEEAAGEDPVVAAEEAVAALVGDDPMTDEIVADLDEMAMEQVAEPALEELAAEDAEAEEHQGNMPPSPVAEMIVRLAEETQYFPEPDVEGDAVAEAPAPKPKPSRKKA